MRAVAEDQVGLGGFVEPQRDLVREQAPDIQHLLARVPDGAGYTRDDLG
jgi:hypothetical protein